MRDFLAMGGYAAYVWPAYAVFFLVLAADWLAPALRRRRLLRELRGRIARQEARERRGTDASTSLPPAT
ncbi:heme exporter protein CcmD [Fulvimonas sp. R45]|uniref:heme exporter protein CcmD n=1 Tax=Fulvimonas sp. R45 TaxID=3045937 RepID=UPI0026601377|nr:heme exporter protein CcmD [Fulvimonas sp. R45]MDO1527446.1 heme exporter protein CcmD [Fulvimonas sp. R45]